MKDLICLVADRDIEATIRAVLGRPGALGLRGLSFDIFTHPRRDPGCFNESPGFLASFRNDYQRALVVFDRDFGGGVHTTAEQLETSLNERLARANLQQWAGVVVIDPEIEIWVWSDSPNVDAALGWTGRQPSLRDWLAQQALWPVAQAKPTDPKVAFRRALRVATRPASPAIFASLGSTVSVDRCTDQSFARFRTILRGWFSL